MYKQASRLNGKIMQLDPVPRSYCECWGGTLNSTARKAKLCQCGEEDSGNRDWTWELAQQPTTKVVDDLSVTFHPVYSQGTAMVRGNKPLEQSRHHYWEIKMTSTVCGTDLMVGIGTDKVDLLANKYRFVSGLGLDRESWGYSYRGITQHDCESRYYGQKFGAGSIVSCHLDLFRGTLEFYLNRRPLGIAFKNIPTKGAPLYPMVCSTAAKSSIKLLNSSSFPECLQFQAIRSISRYPSTLSELKDLPEGFRHQDQLWYLQRTEKFIYNHQDSTRQSDALFDHHGMTFEGGHLWDNIGDEGGGGGGGGTDDDLDIYGDMDEDVQRIQNRRLCHINNNPSESSDEDENVEMVLFSYFCDHF